MESVVYCTAAVVVLGMLGLGVGLGAWNASDTNMTIETGKALVTIGLTGSLLNLSQSIIMYW